MRWFSEFASRIRRGPALGGDAVRAHVAGATGATDPYVFGFDELEVHALRVESPLPHILYHTFGLSRVRSAVPVAGTQTELTLRVPADTPVPYVWPAEQLASMVKQVRRTGNEIAPGHHMRLRGPVTDEAGIEGFTFVTDPVLGVIEPPTGIVRFTYAVGLTADELEAALSWDPMQFTGVLGDVVPLGITAPQRASILTDPAVKARVDAGIARDGSSISAAHAKLLDVDPGGRVDLDPRSANALIRAARHRLPHARPFALVRGDAYLLLSPGGEFEAGESHLQLPASDQLFNEILAVFDAAPGVYRFTTAPVEIHVVDTGT